MHKLLQAHILYAQNGQKKEALENFLITVEWEAVFDVDYQINTSYDLTLKILEYRWYSSASRS